MTGSTPSITVTNRSEPGYVGSKLLCAGFKDFPVDAKRLSRVLTGLGTVIIADAISTDAGVNEAACLGGVDGRDKPGQDDNLKGLQL